jgi:hypothetical protein
MTVSHSRARLFFNRAVKRAMYVRISWRGQVALRTAVARGAKIVTTIDAASRLSRGLDSKQGPQSPDDKTCQNQPGQQQRPNWGLAEIVDSDVPTLHITIVVPDRFKSNPANVQAPRMRREIDVSLTGLDFTILSLRGFHPRLKQQSEIRLGPTIKVGCPNEPAKAKCQCDHPPSHAATLCAGERHANAIVP